MPLPNCPEELSPQHITSPFDRSAHACVPPAEIATVGFMDGEFDGMPGVTARIGVFVAVGVKVCVTDGVFVGVNVKVAVGLGSVVGMAGDCAGVQAVRMKIVTGIKIMLIWVFNSTSSNKAGALNQGKAGNISSAIL